MPQRPTCLAPRRVERAHCFASAVRVLRSIRRVFRSRESTPPPRITSIHDTLRGSHGLVLNPIASIACALAAARSGLWLLLLLLVTGWSNGCVGCTSAGGGTGCNIGCIGGTKWLEGVGAGVGANVCDRYTAEAACAWAG